MTYNDIVDSMSDNQDFELTGYGVSYRDVIVNLFDTFFENKDNLKRFSGDYLVQDYINYSRNKFDKIDICILEIIQVFRDAQITQPELTFKAFALFHSNIVEMGNKYWSMCKMQKDFNELEEYEYVAECFALIENVSEILLKDFFAFLVHILRVKKGNYIELSQVLKNKFGNSYNEIKQSGQFTKMLDIVMSDVSISQWRNIACHKTYKYVNGEIICTYGQDLEYTVTIRNKEELLDLAKSVYRISQVLNFAFKFYVYDNIYKIHEKMDEYGIMSETENMRDETWHLIFVTELYANGFSVLNISDEEKLIVDIRDITNGDIERRAIQSSIAIYKAWCLSEKEKIVVNYYTKEGKPYLSFESTGNVCKKIADGEKDISYLPENMIVKKL